MLWIKFEVWRRTIGDQAKRRRYSEEGIEGDKDKKMRRSL